ncbi:MAG: dihydroneopterin aldolase [Polaromonas sp.]
MALRTTWTVRVQNLVTRLRVGVHHHEHEHQPVIVSLTMRGLSESMPTTLEQCFDYEPICRWITNEWPETGHTALLEMRANELLEQVFNADRRIQDVWIGLYKTEAIEQAERVGVEREMSRRQFEAHNRSPAAHRAKPPPTLEPS